MPVFGFLPVFNFFKKITKNGLQAQIFFWIWKVNSQKPPVMYFGGDNLTLRRHKLISKYRFLQIVLVFPTLKRKKGNKK